MLPQSTSSMGSGWTGRLTIMRFKVMGKRWLLVWVAKGVAFVARRDKDGEEQKMSKTDDGLTEGPWL